MLSLTFIVVFIFCLAIAMAAVWMSRQQLQTYSGHYHKNYFYYLVTFYAFGFYGIWAQILMRVLLSEINTQNEIIITVANFLPILGAPFLILSWMMLVKMGTTLCEAQIRTKLYTKSLALLMLLFPVLMTLVIVVFKREWLKGEQLMQAQLALILIMELVVMLYFTSIVYIQSRALKDRKKKVIRSFAISLSIGFLIRASLLPLVFLEIWYIAPIVLVFFVSNLFPLLYLREKSDLVFLPLFAASASDEKKALLYKKYSITKREREVIEGICNGLTNQQIADELFISLQTVKDHTHRIYSKIGINSRMKLVQIVNG